MKNPYHIFARIRDKENKPLRRILRKKIKRMKALKPRPRRISIHEKGDILEKLAKPRKRKVKTKRTICHSPEWKAFRQLILEKFNHECCRCGIGAGYAQLHVDHIKPKSRHPELAFDPDNLQVLCRECNFAKNTRHETDYRKR